MVVKCLIQFENKPTGTFFAGEVMKGVVTLEADKAKTIKGVLLKIKGFAKTSWSEDSTSSSTNADGSSSTTTNTTHYGSTEPYIKTVTTLMGEEHNVIAPGVHKFAFHCQIPAPCPSSFEGRYGHIRYVAKVVLIRPWTFNQNFSQGFTVLRCKDLNALDPAIRSPSFNGIAKTFGWNLFKNYPLILKASIPQAGFVPGQNIPVAVLADNRSSVTIAEIRLKLEMDVVNYDRPKSRNTQKDGFVLSILKGDPVPRNSKKLFNYLLPVPAAPPTSNYACGIITINYHITVEAVVTGFYRNKTLALPVIIGIIPLSSDRQQVAVDDRDAAGANAWEEDANTPPPTYKEAVYMMRAKINADDKHDYGQREFAPSYAVFNIPSPTALTPEEATKGFMG